MDQEQICKAWDDYIDEQQNPLFGESHILDNGLCFDCKHWNLIDEESLLLIKEQREYKNIILGMQGKIIKAYKEEGKVVDSYTIHQFYGWCKRYPPIQSVTQLMVSDYNFPLISHENTCGEWCKDNEKP